MWGKGVDSQELDDMLEAGRYQVVGRHRPVDRAAGLELSSETAVMAIGGFSGTDPAPTLAQFQDDVAKHRGRVLRQHHIGRPTGQGGTHTRTPTSPDGSPTNFRAIKVGKATVYDLARRSDR